MDNILMNVVNLELFGGLFSDGPEDEDMPRTQLSASDPSPLVM